MTDRHQEAKKFTSRLEVVVKIAILLTLCILVFGPSGIVGSRIVAFYTSWQTRQAIVDQWPTLTDADSRLRGHGIQPTRTIVEFIDYECPFCRQVSSSIAQSVAAEEVDVVIRHFPMASIIPVQGRGLWPQYAVSGTGFSNGCTRHC